MTTDTPTRSAQLILARGNLIGGEWRPADSGAELEVRDPATADVLTTIPASAAPDIDAAVASARESFDAGIWADLAPSERAQVLWRLAALVRENLEDLSYTETRDAGKPIAESREDIAAVADIFDYFAGWATKVVGQTLALPGNQIGLVLRDPVGVVGAITPWNFPMYLAAWKAAPALALGNSLVVKPSSLASLSTVALGSLALEAGVPPGVLNVVTGTGDAAGISLAEHRDVDMLAFTGSTAVGRSVLAARAQLVRPVQVELGGKSPNIVFADADFDRAVAGAAFGIFYTQGENCNAGSRVLVQRSIYDQFVERLVDFARNIRVELPTAETSQMGALISDDHLARVSGFVEGARAEGLAIACGGQRLTESPFGQGNFYAPTVVTDVGAEATIFQEEVFGPVVTVTAFDDTPEAIRLANATDYGLAAGVWTADLDRAMTCARKLKSGYVWINTFNTTPVEAPFGGVKGSGFGRECGVQALDNYTTWKTVAVATSPFEDWYGG